MKTAVRVLTLCTDILLPRRCPFCDEATGFSGPCRRCAERLRPVYRTPGAPVPPSGHEARFTDFVYAPYFYESIVQRTILQMKFYDRPDFAAPLAAEMAKALRAADALPVIHKIVPVPSSRSELRRRGYDVPGRLARALGRELDLPMVRALRKTRETVPQAQLSGKERRQNLRGAFALRSEAAVTGECILLVDDVYTTGTTLDECAKVLKEAGAASCIGICLATVR